MIKLGGLETGLEELDTFKLKSKTTGYITDGPFMFIKLYGEEYDLFELEGSAWVTSRYNEIVKKLFMRGLLEFIKYTPAELDDEGEEKMDLLDKTLGMQVYINEAEGRVVLKTEDGDTYKAKCSVDDEFDIEKGVMLAMLKECYGPRVYDTIEALVAEAINSDRSATVKSLNMKFGISYEDVAKVVSKSLNFQSSTEKTKIVAGDSYRATNYNDAKKALKLLEDQCFSLWYYTHDELEETVKMHLKYYGEVYFITYYDKEFQPANHGGGVKVHNIK